MSYLPYDTPLTTETFSLEEISNRLPEKYRQPLLDNIKSKVKEGKKVRVICDGCFDLFHLGHSRNFEQAKKMIPGIEVHLIAGVCTDKDILVHKGQPVSPFHSRKNSNFARFFFVNELKPTPRYIFVEKILTFCRL